MKIRDSLISLLCISHCENKEFIEIIMLFIESNIIQGELLFIDSGAEDRTEFIETLGLDRDLALRIHYQYAPECVTPEEKVSLISECAKGDFWHFITPDTRYPKNYFRSIIKKLSVGTVGAQIIPVYIPALQSLRGVHSRANHFSHLGMFGFHKSYYERNGIWFNTTGDQASVGTPLTELDIHSRPVCIASDLVSLCNSGMLLNSRYLDINQSSVDLTDTTYCPKINWSLIDKIVYINLSTRPDRQVQLVEGLKSIGVPDNKIIRFDAIYSSTGAEGCTGSHIAVLEMAKENKWQNVLILEDDICFVQSEELEQQLNRSFAVLEGCEWDVVMLSANYQDVLSLGSQRNIVKVNKAFTTGAYVVNNHYYDTLIANYQEGLDYMRSTGNREQFALDNYWHQLMVKHRWLGIWPCFAYQAPGYSDIERKELDYLPLFYKPLESLFLSKLKEIEKKHLERFNNNISDASDYIALESVYRAKNMHEIADYFYCLQQDEAYAYKHNDQWPLLSVIITTFNQSRVLIRTLDSILRQRYPNMEVIVMDDNSTDDTQERLAEIDDPRLCIVRNRMNLQGARNLSQGFYHHAKGEYTFIIDHDDLLLDRDYLMDAVMLLEYDKSLSFVFANNSDMYEQHHQILSGGRNAANSKINGKVYFKEYLKSGYPNILYLTAVFRRSLVIKTGALVDEGIVDIHLFHRLMLVGNVGFISRMPAVYRIHPNSITFNINNTTDIYIDQIFMQHLEETAVLAIRNGLPRPEIKEWLSNVACAHFVNWRLPNIIKNQGYNLTLAIYSWLYAKYPEIGVRIIALMHQREK